MGNTISLCVVMLYMIIFVCVTTYLDLGAFNFINVCLGIPEGTHQYIAFMAIMIQNTLLIGLTIALDCANKTTIEHMVVYISPQMRQAMEEQRGHDEIARRAIYINICLFLPWVFYPISGKYTY